MTTLYIHRVAEREIRRESVGDMWCFHCRKRLPHDAVARAPVDPMSYYGPRWNFECSRCHHDHTLLCGVRDYRFGGES